LNRYQTPVGFLKYRNPSIVETIKLVRILREYFSNDDLVGARLSIMENISDLLDYSEMEGVKNFDDLNKQGTEVVSALYEISDEILNKVIGAFAKKS